MKNSATVAALLMACVFSASAEDALPPKPKAEFTEREYDYGTVAEGVKISHNFSVKNAGTGILAIQSLFPACGCTAAAVDKENLQPGETATIKVDFDTAGFSGFKQKDVRVFLNDPDQMSSVLSLKGNVIPEVEIAPASASFGEVSRNMIDKTSPREVEVSIKAGERASITGAQSYSKYLSVRDLGGSKDKRRFSIALDASAPRGEFRDRILVSLSGASRDYVNIPVSATISSDIQISPKTLSFGIIEGGAPIQRSFKLENLGPRELSIKTITPSSAAVTTEVAEIKPGRIYMIKVSVDPAKVAGDLRASLDILTSSEEEPNSTVNLFGIMPPRA